MNLKVIHLIRKLERIDRDLEEIQTMLNTIQMDREYSKKLKDSLIDEYHRLKQLKTTILKQVVLIPPHFEQFIEETVLNHQKKEKNPKIEIISINKPENSTKFIEDNSKKIDSTENNSSKFSKEKKISSKNSDEKTKKSPFIFKFE